ncbi:MAG: sulfatase-like hydrolase/transferase [bacterium]|nr:sulfatase-like hydrolase/transferase [bacterium]
MLNNKYSGRPIDVLIILILIAACSAIGDTLLQLVISRTIARGFLPLWDFTGKSLLAFFVTLLLVAGFLKLVFLIVKRRNNDKRLYLVWTIGISTAITLLIITFLPFNDYLFPPYTSLAGALLNVAWLAFIAVIGVFTGLIANKLLKRKPRFGKPVFYSLSGLIVIFTLISFFIYDGIPKGMKGKKINGPDIIIISFDALRRDYVSSYCNDYVETPNLDTFAERGYRYENSCSNSPWTLPSLMTMCTGQYPSVHGIEFEKLPADLPTFAQVLKGHGYRTEAYTGNGVMKREYGFEKGFDKYLVHTEDDWYYPIRNTAVGRLLYQIDRKAPSFLKLGKHTDSTIWCTETLCDRVITLRRDDKPYFLWVHLMDPHTPLTPPLEYINREEKEAIKLRDFGLSKTIGSNEDNYDVKNKDTLIELYAAEVRYVDDVMGSVVEMFDDYGVWDDTLIILTADHGEEHFEHGEYGHCRTLYDDITAVPLIVHFPDESSGVIDTPSSVIDIPTTVLSYIGSDKTAITEGNDLYSYIRPDKAVVTYIYADRTDKDLEACSIRDDEFVLIHYTLDIGDTKTEKDSWELYKYKQDPYLKNNIVGLYPEKAAGLRTKLLSFKAETDKKASEFGDSKGLKLSTDDKGHLRDLGYF